MSQMEDMPILVPECFKKFETNFMPENQSGVIKTAHSNECILCAKLKVLLSEGPFYQESVVIYSFILVHQI